MTSKTIPPEGERRRSLGAFIWNMMPSKAANQLSISEAENLATHVWTFLQPNREAVIEECAKAVESESYRDEHGERAAEIIRSLKHSDTTPEGGENG